MRALVVQVPVRSLSNRFSVSHHDKPVHVKTRMAYTGEAND